MKWYFHHLHFFVESYSLFFREYDIQPKDAHIRGNNGRSQLNDTYSLFQEGAETFVIHGSDSFRGSFRICINHQE